MKSHSINDFDNFIAGWTIDNTQLCDELIDYFEKSDKKKTGKLGRGEIDKKRKNSTDLSLSPYPDDLDDAPKKYLKVLLKVINEYKKLYIYCDKQKEEWGIREPFNIQRYFPNEGFYQWHSERGGLAKADRHLVFMTYLNDVVDGGETEWYHQKMKIKPEKGLTVIWPTDWTYTHRGLTSPTQTKYIATGWFNFLS